MHHGELAQETPEPFVPIDGGVLKRKINEMIWQYGRPTLSLEVAEDTACKVYNLLSEVMRAVDDTAPA